MPNFIKFPSVERLHNIVKEANERPEAYPARVSYVGKVKLHGTNSAVGKQNGEIFAQKRKNIVTVDNDNFEFAQFVKEREDKFQEVLNEGEVLYGEWVGPGIQKGVAISNIDQRYFFVFALHKEDDNEEKKLFYDPYMLQDIVDKLNDERVLNIPYYTDPIQVDLHNKPSLQEFSDIIDKHVKNVGEKCPVAKEFFNVDGEGEGIVFFPVDQGSDRDTISRLMFKVKSEKHDEGAGGKKGKKEKKKQHFTTEEIKTQNEFVERFCTEERLKQIAEEDLNNDFDMKKTGDFLKAFNKDVMKETEAEREKNGIDWKKIQKPINDEARKWWVKKCKQLF